MKILRLEQIRAVLPGLDLLPAIEEGFLAYSHDRAVVPPVGELLLDQGEVHIKYGFIRGQRHYVIKIASGFYGNPGLGLPSGQGLMLLFDQATGVPVCLLQDEGLLTDIRTAVAGAIAARLLAPGRVNRIGVVGTGTQARLQARYLQEVVPCRDLLVWGRGQPQLDRYRESMAQTPFRIDTTTDISELQQTCNLIVTTTTSAVPLLAAADLQPGTHITAVGSDTPSKQELEAEILAAADVVAADSRSQCRERGEIHHALEAGLLEAARVVEIGELICSRRESGRGAATHRCAHPGRTSDDQITVADLTGVAVQDIQIADAVFRAVG